jgi:cytochrome c oxidase cbb3-type subunit 2
LNGEEGKVVATNDALYLIAYLQSLKQIKLAEGSTSPEFLYKRKQEIKGGSSQTQELDGTALYTANCQSCHQANGEGLPGAFPPLKGSPIVNADNLEPYIDIIMNGYDARAEFGVMPPVGTNANLSPSEIAAIMNHERTAWGNNAKKITEQEVKKIMDFVKLKAAK